MSTFSKERISPLEDLLSLCLKKQLPVNLEIKLQSRELHDRIIVEEVIKTVKSADAAHLVLISSFCHPYLRQIHSLAPEIPTAALVEKKHPEDLRAYLKSLGVAAYHPDWQICDEALIDELKEDNIRVNLWTVNDPNVARRFIRAGAGFICTDWPQKMVGKFDKA